MPPEREQRRAAFFLVGPTAVGKTAVAHLLARQRGWEILSADAMLVYRGMDVGTAKPSAVERQQVPYGGIDLVAPNVPFSTGDYIREAAEAVAGIAARRAMLIVAGGTGLYVKALTEGLDRLPPADPALRRRAEELLTKGVAVLQDELKRLDPARLASLKDKRNPRRLIRALELARHPPPSRRGWKGKPQTPLIGLRMPSAALYERIRSRVEHMYAAGLLDEVRGLVERYGELSTTAAQAIGYREALSVLSHKCSLEQAVEDAAGRTRHLAKRQMTWFRHQANVAWLDVEPGMSVEDVARGVTALWEEHGPTDLAV